MMMDIKYETIPWISENLVMCFCGKHNNITGHIANPGIWWDWSGNGHDMTLQDTNNILSYEFGDSFLWLPTWDTNSRYDLPWIDLSDVNKPNDGYTLEFTAYSGGVWFRDNTGGLVNNNSYGGGTLASQVWGKGIGTSVQRNVTHSYSFLLGYSEQKVYKDGVLNGSLVNSHTQAITRFAMWLSYDARYERNRWYAIRLYNRVLKEAEVISNFKVDKHRYKF
ncbi:MAG: hypothetical protein IJK48_09190 [Bacteroidales bacterium]|nr:hypothetical protein [Bacteroidales bacterium]